MTTKPIKAQYRIVQRGRAFQVTITSKAIPRGRERRSFATEIDADTWGLEQIKRLKQGLSIDLGNMQRRSDDRPHTIHELLDYTVAERWSKRTTTLKQIKLQAKSLVDTIGPTTPITKCDYYTISNALQRLEDGTGIPDRRNSGASINRKWAFFRVMLGYAVKLGIIIKIPEIERRPESPPRDFRVSPALEKLMLSWGQVHGEHEFQDFLLLGIYVGARENELLKLTLDKLSSASGYVDGNHIVLPHPNPLIKNKGMRRDIKMAPWIKAIADRRRAELHGQNGRLLPTLTKSRINHIWRKMKLDPIIKAEVEMQEHPRDFVPHILRHEFCSRLGDLGTEAFELMRLSGHKSVQAVQRYVRVKRDRTDEIMDRLFAATVPQLSVINGGMVGSGNV